MVTKSDSGTAPSRDIVNEVELISSYTSELESRDELERIKGTKSRSFELGSCAAMESSIEKLLRDTRANKPARGSFPPVSPRVAHDPRALTSDGNISIKYLTVNGLTYHARVSSKGFSFVAKLLHGSSEFESPSYTSYMKRSIALKAPLSILL